MVRPSLYQRSARTWPLVYSFPGQRQAAPAALQQVAALGRRSLGQQETAVGGDQERLGRDAGGGARRAPRPRPPELAGDQQAARPLAREQQRRDDVEQQPRGGRPACKPGSRRLAASRSEIAARGRRRSPGGLAVGAERRRQMMAAAGGAIRPCQRRQAARRRVVHRGPAREQRVAPLDGQHVREGDGGHRRARSRPVRVAGEQEPPLGHRQRVGARSYLMAEGGRVAVPDGKVNQVGEWLVRR